MEYICVEDFQNTSFHVGDTMTPEEWQEWALSMNDMDESEYRDEFAKLSPTDAVEYISDMWQIEIVPYDENDKRHQELRKQWEEENV